jgi:flagellar biosynthesis/type III secretory pathway chaperone
MSEKSKEERVVDYVTSIAALDEAMKPFKEQKTDLRKSYLENGWLTKEEIKTALKAYRLRKDNTDMEQLTEMFDMMPEQED